MFYFLLLSSLSLMAVTGVWEAMDESNSPERARCKRALDGGVTSEPKVVKYVTEGMQSSGFAYTEEYIDAIIQNLCLSSAGR